MVAMVLALCAAVPPAYGVIPGSRGYTGLLLVPTADAMMKGEWNVGVFSEDVSETVTSYFANYGVVDHLEVGINRFRPNDDASAGTLLNLKYQFFRSCPERFGLAAGIIDLTDDFDTTVYMVGSASFIQRPSVWYGEVLGPRAHLGVGGGYLGGFFAGLSTWFGNRFQVVAEWDSENINVGGKFRITPDITVHAGGFNLAGKENPGLSFDDTTTFGVGIDYNYSY
jgi:hypothetical protein